MKDLHFTTDVNNINYIDRKLFNKKNKYLCKLKTKKFRAQPIKILVSALYFWKFITTDLRKIQYLNFTKYNRIQFQVSNLKVGNKISVPVELNVLNALDVACQPWFIILGTVLVFSTTSNHLYLFNIKKIKNINVTKSKARMIYQSPKLLNYKDIKTSSKYLLNQEYNTKLFKFAKSVQRGKLFLLIKSKLKFNLKNQKKTYKKVILFKKPVKKFSKKWYGFERKKFKRFKNKYDGRDLKNAPLLTFCQANASKFKKWLFIKYQNRVIFIKNFIIEEIARKKRLKLLLGDKKKAKSKKQKAKSKKQKAKYPKFKYQYKRRKKQKKNKIISVQIKEHYVKNSHVSTPQKTKFKNTKYQHKLQKSAKIKFINKLFFKSKKIIGRKASKYSIKSKNLKQTIKYINKQINYKIKWLNYYEFKSFRWKFHKKRWYFVMSRWKRLSEFRRMLRDAWRNHRKLQKNFLFIKLLRANFKHILGISEEELLKKWIKIRRGTNLSNTISSVEYLNQSLQLKLDSLSLFLGFAPNRLMAQEFIHFGGFRINGNVITDKNFSLHQGDMLQLDTKVIQEIRALYKDTHWKSVRARLKFVPFLQTQWSIMLFMLIRWPQNHELFEESILNQRWVRFFIRYFPIRISKYKKAKIKWYKY